jgi:hypothetical protein
MRWQFKVDFKCLLLFSGAVILSVSSFAQALIPFEQQWKQATLILTSGDTLRGQASLTLPNDIVKILQPDGRISVFTPVNINKLEVLEMQKAASFQDPKNSLNWRREYKTYMWDHDNPYGNFKSPALFVILTSGNYSLLMREERRRQNNAASTSVIGYGLGLAAADLAEQTIIEKWYLSTPNQQIKPLRKPKQDLLSLFPANKKEIEKYAATNKLKFNNLFHLARIVAYANSLNP